MPETSPTDLTPAEQAYFDSQGATAPDAAPAAPAEQPPAAVETPAAPAAAETPQPAQAEEPKHVPLAALHEERNRRKELAKQLEIERQTRERLAGRLDVLNQAIQARQPQAAPLDPETAPIETLKDLNEWRQRQEQAQQAQEQLGQFNQIVAASTTEFAGKTPDFGDAIKYLEAGRIAEYRAMGYQDHQIGQLIQQEAMSIMAGALQRGANPAGTLYEIAKARGYAAKAPEPAADPAATAAAAMQKAADQLQTIAKGQAAAKSLSSTGGATNDALTLEALASMSNEEFAHLKDSEWEKLWR